jgi:hypothetical protein
MLREDNGRLDADLTIAELIEIGGRLGLFCDACSRFRYVRTDGISGELSVADIAEKLSCVRCWSPIVSTRPVQRDPKTGYWPAESG